MVCTVPKRNNNNASCLLLSYNSTSPTSLLITEYLSIIQIPLYSYTLQAFAWWSDLMVEHAETFLSLYAVDMDAALEVQPPDSWDSFPLFQLLNDYLRLDCKNAFYILNYSNSYLGCIDWSDQQLRRNTTELNPVYKEFTGTLWNEFIDLCYIIPLQFHTIKRKTSREWILMQSQIYYLSFLYNFAHPWFHPWFLHPLQLYVCFVQITCSLHGQVNTYQ